MLPGRDEPGGVATVGCECVARAAAHLEAESDPRAEGVARLLEASLASATAGHGNVGQRNSRPSRRWPSRRGSLGPAGAGRRSRLLTRGEGHVEVRRSTARRAHLQLQRHGSQSLLVDGALSKEVHRAGRDPEVPGDLGSGEPAAAWTAAQRASERMRPRPSSRSRPNAAAAAAPRSTMCGSRSTSSMPSSTSSSRRPTRGRLRATL